MAGDYAGDHVAEVGLRIDAVELAGFDQRRDRCPVLATAIRAGEERILAGERNRPDGAFDDVVVDLDVAIVEEAGEARPAGERIADRLGEFCSFD